MYRKSGFAPVWIILLIALLGGIFAISRGYINLPNNNSSPNNPGTSSTAQPTGKKLSLREVCLDKIRNIPAPPFSYESKNTLGTLLPLYRTKERFPNEDKANACITNYRVWNVREKAFKDMGFDYYVLDRSGRKQLNYPAVNKQFSLAVDRAYTVLMGAKNWKKISADGEREGGLPYIVYYKEDGVYKMYVDVTQGTDQYFFVTLTIIGP